MDSEKEDALIKGTIYEEKSIFYNLGNLIFVKMDFFDIFCIVVIHNLKLIIFFYNKSLSSSYKNGLNLYFKTFTYTLGSLLYLGSYLYMQ